jgi:hypothetical protein
VYLCANMLQVNVISSLSPVQQIRLVKITLNLSCTVVLCTAIVMYIVISPILMQAPSFLEMSLTDTRARLNELSWDRITIVCKLNYPHFRSHTFQNCFPWLATGKWYQICEALKKSYKSQRFGKSLLQQMVPQEWGKTSVHNVYHSLLIKHTLQCMIIFPDLYLKNKNYWNQLK